MRKNNKAAGAKIRARRSDFIKLFILPSVPKLLSVAVNFRFIYCNNGFQGFPLYKRDSRGRRCSRPFRRSRMP